MGAVLNQKAICFLLKDKGAAKLPCTNVAEIQHQQILPVRSFDNVYFFSKLQTNLRR